MFSDYIERVAFVALYFVAVLWKLNRKLPEFREIYCGYAGGGYRDVPSMSGAQLVCIEAVYANNTYGASMMPFEQFQKGHDCYASYGKDANIWTLAKYSSDTQLGINCSTSDVLCRVSIM